MLLVNNLCFSFDNKSFLLEAELEVHHPLAEVFEFFSSAENLEYLTPEYLHFKITSPRPIDMRQGALIDYQLKLHGIPFSWQTSILRICHRILPKKKLSPS